MPPFPQDSDDDPEEMFIQDSDDEDFPYDEGDMENAIVLDDNDAPGLDEVIDDLNVDDGISPEDAEEIENGYIPDDSKIIIQKHDGSVFCVAISPTNKDVILSGGEDDKGFITKISSDEVLLELGDHKDSVICCGFNNDGKLVMTADMSGTIVVRNVEDGKTIWDFDCGDLEWCVWHSKANVVFGAPVDGDIYMWKIPSGECKIFSTHGSKSTSNALSASGKELFVGYEDGSVKLWDLKAGTALFHGVGDLEDSVICVAAQSTNKMFGCGTGKGLIRLYNETGKALFVLNAAINSSGLEERSIEGLKFGSDENYLASCSLDGRVCIWSLQHQNTRHELKHPSGVSHLVWLRKSNTVVTASLDGVLRQFDVGNGSLVKEMQGHRGHILDVVVFEDEKSVLTAGDDETCRVFEL